MWTYPDWRLIAVFPQSDFVAVYVRFCATLSKLELKNNFFSILARKKNSSKNVYLVLLVNPVFQIRLKKELRVCITSISTASR